MGGPKKLCPRYEETQMLLQLLNNITTNFHLLSYGSHLSEKIIRNLTLEKIKNIKCNNSTGMTRLYIRKSVPKKYDNSKNTMKLVEYGWVCNPVNNGCNHMEYDAAKYDLEISAYSTPNHIDTKGSKTNHYANLRINSWT